MSAYLTPNNHTTNVLLKFENEQPTDADFAVIGKMALTHNAIEWQLEALVWLYIGDVDKGHMATCRLGAVEMTNTLLTLVEWTEPEDDIADAIKWVVEYFHVLRIKRNAVVHGFNFKADRATGRLFLERRTKSLIFQEFDEFEITPKTLQDMLIEQAELSMFLHQLGRVLEQRGPECIGPGCEPPTSPSSLPPRPPEPQTLAPLTREIPRSARSQRRALLESEAKQKKLDGKAAQRADAKKKLTGD